MCALFSFYGTHLIAEAEKCVNGHQAKVISGLLSRGLVSHREEKWALETVGSNPSSDARCECGVRFLSLSLSSANEGVHSVPTALNSIDDD